MFFEAPDDVSAGMQLMMQRLSLVTTEEGVSRGLSFKPRSDDVFVVTPPKCSAFFNYISGGAIAPPGK
jgi:hypothetical protein